MTLVADDIEEFETTAQSPKVAVTPNEVWPSVVVIAISAVIGGIIALAISFGVTFMGIVMSGPLGWLLLGPAALAAFATAIAWVVVGVPIWAVIGGYMFGNMSSGNGSAAKYHGVIFFSKDHAISKRTNELAADLGLPPIPYIGWYPAPEINAFAMGTQFDNTLIALSEGAIEKLTKQQLDAIIAHELGHVVSKDMFRMTWLKGAQEALTFFLVFRKLKKFARFVFSPIAELERLRFSRQREFAADKVAAQLTHPHDVIGVFQAIQFDREAAAEADGDTMVNGRSTGNIWRTHPTLESRIGVLRDMKVTPHL